MALVCDMMADYCKQYEGITVLCLLLLATWQRTIANGECGWGPDYDAVTWWEKETL